MPGATIAERRTSLKQRLVKDLKPLTFVDGDKTYRVIVQLGARQHWRGLGPGKWDKVAEEEGRNRGEKKITFEHRAAVGESPPLSGHTVNGLIQQHNEWLEKNATKTDLDGLLNRMLCVLEIKETKEAPVDVQSNMEMTPENVGKIAAATATAVVDAILSAQNKGGKG